jgi:hypothetical protein
MKKIIIAIVIVFASGIFTGCNEEEVAPSSRSDGESALPRDGGI